MVFSGHTEVNSACLRYLSKETSQNAETAPKECSLFISVSERNQISQRCLRSIDGLNLTGDIDYIERKIPLIIIVIIYLFGMTRNQKCKYIIDIIIKVETQHIVENLKQFIYFLPLF